MAVVMKDVAERLGVSRTAVSYALSGTGRLDPQTRERIRQAAAEMGYRPNLAASSMQTGRTRSIGVILGLSDPFFATVLSSIHDTLAPRGYMPLLLAPSKREPLLDQLHRLIDRRVDGIILRPPAGLDADIWRTEVEKWHIPLVTIDAPLPTAPHVDYVGTDDKTGGSLVAEHLLANGHRRFGMLLGPWFHTTQARAEGFEQKLRTVHGTLCSAISAAPFDAAEDAAIELLKLQPRPTAIFAVTDPLAFGVYQAAQKLGIQIGSELSLVGYSDAPSCSLLAPPLSSVQQSPEDMGEQAARFLLDRVEAQSSDELPPRRLEATPTLIVRGSSGPAEQK
ncbi:MAG TPA: hypothetical protein DCR55_13330 [Lentisphaeria bacterium]|jgi:LacI family transcriptional regulator|nr:hypothetical protein [Lentisphaeria bacterium]